MSEENRLSSQASGKPVGYFTSVGGDLNAGLPKTNPSSSQGGTWAWGLFITSPALYPLGRAASWQIRTHVIHSELGFQTISDHFFKKA